MPDTSALPPGSAIKSRPVYAPLRLDASGTRHLLVVDRDPLPPQYLADGVASFAASEIWTVLSDSRLAPEPAGPGEPRSVRRCRSVAQLLTLLESRLARETTGFRLYAVGSEAFVWDVGAISRAGGLASDEFFPCATDHARRRVYCVHCRTMNQDVAATVTLCVGCGAHLLVRDHFSRRLAAFMGVQADAELADELPLPESFA